MEIRGSSLEKTFNKGEEQASKMTRGDNFLLKYLSHYFREWVNQMRGNGQVVPPTVHHFVLHKDKGSGK